MSALPMTNSRAELELLGAVALDQLDAERGELVAHRRIDVGVAAGDAVAGLACDRSEAAHEGAADAENVQVHRTILGSANTPGACRGAVLFALQAARLSRAALTVQAMSSCVWAALTKPASYSAGAKYTPRVEHGVEEAVEALLVARHHLGVVLRQLAGRSRSRTCRRRIGVERARRLRCAASSRPSTRLRVRAASASKKPGSGDLAQRREAGAVATGLPESVPA